jgi:hypothetical protein
VGCSELKMFTLVSALPKSMAGLILSGGFGNLSAINIVFRSFAVELSC